MFKVWYIFNSNGRLYVLFRYWKKVVDIYDTRSNINNIVSIKKIGTFFIKNNYIIYD